MKALITGITGQDGSYLAEFLLEKGYTVYGGIRRTSHDVLEHLPEAVSKHAKLIYLDLCDPQSIEEAINTVMPDEIYNLAAQSHVWVSFKQPEYTMLVNAIGPLRILDAIRRIKPDCKFYQASSSEMFGTCPPPQSEKTSFHPRSPYGVSKVAAHNITVNYREAYGIFACCGILFNHESPRRGKTFVTRKIAMAVAEILTGARNKLELGNLDAKRDWGYAKEYVEQMWKMLQQPKPDDYVIATGETHSVREFVEEAFGYVGLNWEDYVVINKEFYRPAEVYELRGNITKAKEKLGWEPSVKFKDLVRLMVESELQSIRSGN